MVCKLFLEGVGSATTQCTGSGSMRINFRKTAHWAAVTTFALIVGFVAGWFFAAGAFYLSEAPLGAELAASKN
jgi:hypothetical protein